MHLCKHLSGWINCLDGYTSYALAYTLSGEYTSYATTCTSVGGYASYNLAYTLVGEYAGYATVGTLVGVYTHRVAHSLTRSSMVHTSNVLR